MQDTPDERAKQIPIGRMIHMLSHQMKRQRSEDPLKDEELTAMQKHVLNFILLETLDRDVYQKDIEEEFQIRKSTATGILKLIEKNGYICRECEKRDARLKKIVPTKKAEVLRPVLLKNIRNTEHQLTEGIAEAEFEECRKVLYLMLRNLAEKEKRDKEEIENHE